ncbi:MAG: hypothetical protein SGJ19_20155 [Planctomycetia bacterium]|nr:hypothetical protein [Planctomycetia bacterium]
MAQQKRPQKQEGGQLDKALRDAALTLRKRFQLATSPTEREVVAVQLQAIRAKIRAQGKS